MYKNFATATLFSLLVLSNINPAYAGEDFAFKVESTSTPKMQNDQQIQRLFELVAWTNQVYFEFLTAEPENGVVKVNADSLGILKMLIEQGRQLSFTTPVSRNLFKELEDFIVSLSYARTKDMNVIKRGIIAFELLNEALKTYPSLYHPVAQDEAIPQGRLMIETLEELNEILKYHYFNKDAQGEASLALTALMQEMPGSLRESCHYFQKSMRIAQEGYEDVIPYLHALCLDEVVKMATERSKVKGGSIEKPAINSLSLLRLRFQFPGKMWKLWQFHD